MTATTAAAALLATTALGVVPAVAVTTAPPLAPAGPVHDDADDKLSTAAREQLAAGPTDFWVDLADAADLSAAPSVADWDARGQYVYDALTTVAAESQADLVKELDAAGASYRSFWISNRILVEDGTLALATDLAGSPEVEAILETTTLELVDPVEKKKASERGTTAVEWGVAAINADDVWEMGYTGEGITVSNIDTGVQVDHPALASQYRGTQADGTVVNDYNWFDSSNACSGAPCDGNGHGTHTMGTMAGDDGAANQIGVAPDARWIAANGCATCSDADLLESGQWILAPTRTDGSDPDPAQRPHIVNNSWGLTAPGVIDDFMAEEIAAWEAAGIFGSWSAGNSGPSCQTTSSPGANVSTYAVGAFDSSGTIAGFSSRGPGEDGAVQPNIAAPGVNVRSALPGSGYGSYSGTSMAAPHLAGAVAVLWSAAPALVGDIETTRELLDLTAVDVDNTTCGGTPEDNNVWGEGKLDLLALIDAAPIGPTGYLAGTVTDSDGSPIAGATVTVDGENDRTARTDTDGSYSVRVAVGEYSVSATAFGFLDSEPVDVTVTEDATTTTPIVLQTAPTHAVSGTVTDSATGAAVEGALVELSAPIEPASTGADGTYAITAVPEGTYTLSITAGACAEPFSTSVTVDGDEVVDAALASLFDEEGYYCTVGSEGAASGDTPTSLAGDDSAVRIDLPFSFPFYGETYDTAWASTNGFLNFLASSTAFSNGAIPSTSVPNAAIYPFWDDLRFDSAAALYTGTTTVDGNEAFVLEWRDAPLYTDGSSTLTFSVTLVSNGVVVIGYGDQTGDHASLSGASATIGIENAEGAVASQYSYNASVVTPGLSIRYQGAPMGILGGTVTDLNTGEPVDGAVVTATPTDDGDVKTTTTGADGTYELPLLLGDFVVEAAADRYVASTETVTITEDTITPFSPSLAAGRVTVEADEMSSTLPIGGSADHVLTVTNDGTAPASVELDAGGGTFDMLGGAAIEHVIGDATVPASTTPGRSLDRAGGSLSTSGVEGGAVTPTAVVPQDATTITHSASQAIVANSSASCNDQVTTDLNQYLRTFTLSDFGIGSDFAVSEVSFGVETTQAGQPITVNLYTLDGDLVYANLTPIGSADTDLSAQTQTVVSVPVEGVVPSGGTLVVEIVAAAGGRFFIGSNGEGQTAPSYIASDACGIPEPTDTASIGFPDMHVVMNVSGEAGGAPADWLSLDPATVTLAPGESVAVTATMSGDVEQPGTYTASIGADTDTPYTVEEVGATMVVEAPARWGKITGTVTGAVADGEPMPLEGALVQVDGKRSDVTLVTHADGTFEYWHDVRNGPLRLIVVADGYVPQTATAKLVAGRVTVTDFHLEAR